MDICPLVVSQQVEPMNALNLDGDGPGLVGARNVVASQRGLMLVPPGSSVSLPHGSSTHASSRRAKLGGALRTASWVLFETSQHDGIELGGYRDPHAADSDTGAS